MTLSSPARHINARLGERTLEVRPDDAEARNGDGHDERAADHSDAKHLAQLAHRELNTHAQGREGGSERERVCVCV